MDLIEKISKQLPKIESDINYWLIRTNSGEYYDEFVYEDYVGIGWNKVTLEQLNRNQPIGGIVKEHYKDENRPGYVGKQIIRFVEEIKKGDIVLIPSKNSKYLYCGYIADDAPYEEDIPIETEDPNSIETFDLEEDNCPHRKRRKVNWIKPLKRTDLDPRLYLLVYSHHTISNANEYGELINRAIYDMYIKDGKCHATFYIDKKDNVEARELVYFISDLLEINNLKNKANKDSLEIKISVQSPGITEIIDKAQNIVWTCIVIYSIIGGKFKIPMLLEVETKGIVGRVKEFVEMKLKNKQISEKSKERLKKTAEDLQLKLPSGLEKSIKESQNKNTDD